MSTEWADEILEEALHGLPEPPPEVRVVPFEEFVSREEPTAEALLGTPGETILPVGGMLLMYGDGGAGKTTLTIDAVSHLASGESWLGIDVQRPVKTLLIENEGPRGKFRQRLAEKHASWNGHPPFSLNVHVLEEPWTRFTLREPDHRAALAEAITANETDLVVMGPLVTLGMLGGGTPDEVQQFEGLLLSLKELVQRPYALWIIHHENKAGDVSGAWERVPDCLCHVQAQGNGHTRLYFRKARWSDSYHNTSLDLTWADGRTFLVREDEEIDYHAEIVTAFAKANEWRTVKETRDLVGRMEKPVREALSDLVSRGEMEFAKGPAGRVPQARCYRLRSALEAAEHFSAVLPLEGVENRTALLRSPYKESSSGSADQFTPESALGGASALLDEDPGF